MKRGEASAFSELVEHMPPLREFCEPSVYLSPDMVGPEEEGKRRGEVSGSPFSGIQQSLGNNELDNVHR